ncbi:MAG: hypothetical protein AAGB31_01485 [Bdellovibrio sp.]
MVKNALIVTYILIVLAISAVARAGVFPNQGRGEGFLTSDLQNYNYKTYVGEVAALANGSLILVLEDQSILSLKSQMDLTSFIGSKVMIGGIELEHQLAPNFELKSVDPLPGLDSGSKAVVFFVFSIGEVRQ